MPSYTLSVRGYRAIRRADVEIEPVALVGARNAAGKSSLIQAAQACLIRQPVLVPGVLVKTADMLIHDGETRASASVRGDDLEVKVVWPECREAHDEGAPRATPIAAGIHALPDIPAKDRPALLATYIEALPSEKRVAQELADIGFTEKQIPQVQAIIDEKGWDEAAARAHDRLVKAKADWETATGEKYGAKKADGWTPQGWTDDLSKVDPVELESDVAAAQAAVDRAIGAGAVTEAEVVRLREVVEAAKPSAVEVAEVAIEKIDGIIAKLEEQLAEVPSYEEDAALPCPHCHKLLVPEPRVRPERLKLMEGKPPTEAQVKAARLKLAEIEGAIARNKAEQRQAHQALDAAKRAIPEAEAAKVKLAEIEENGSGADILIKARADLEAAAARLRMAKAQRAAAGYHATADRYAKLEQMLLPAGLRARALVDALDAFNAELAAASATAGWPAVAITADLNVAMGGRPYHLLSESWQARARITLQVCMAKRDGSAMILIDRFDMFDPGGRNGLFKLLKQTGIPAIVVGTFSKPDLIPDIAKAGIGRRYWIEGGEVAEL